MVPGVVEVIVAVKLTLAPTVDGFRDEASAAIVAAFAAAFTTCESVDEVLVAKFESPLYLAVIECVPCVSEVVA
jgi:hypothetical protein